MQNLGRELVLNALAATGSVLAEADQTEPVRVVLCGAAAGILGGDLGGQRQTLDCDVIESEPGERFGAVRDAASIVAEQHGLKADWLNQESRRYAHLLPPGWTQRLRPVGRFGPLEVLAVGRRDLLALKLMGTAQRPQDLEDIESMSPSGDELDFLARYLDQTEAESLDRETFDAQRAVLQELRQQP